MSKCDSYRVHEALHMALFPMQSVDSELLENDAIKQNVEWLKLAEASHQALFDLYQAIGRVHLNDKKT